MTAINQLNPATIARRRSLAWGAVGLMVFATLSPALAHTGEGVVGGFASGFMHPILGWDHVAAMFAVGLWGAFLGAPAIWLLPIIFPLVMAFGGGLGIMGIPIPGVEIGIAASAVVLGLMVALGARPPIWVAAIIVGCFAIFHGHAHGTELPAAADVVSFAVGFVVGTGVLHLAGIALGLTTKWEPGKVVVRTMGGVIAVAGLAFLTGVA